MFSGVTAQDASPDASPASEGSLLADLGYPEIRVTTDGTEHDLPDELEAGRYHVILQNQGEMEVELSFVQLPEGVTPEDVTTQFEEAEAAPEFVPPEVFFDMVWGGGAGAPPGGTGEVILDLAPGEWVVNLFTYNPETDEENDAFHELTVTGELPELDEVPGAVEIGMAEMYFEVPDSFASGPQVWKAVNNGLQVHHIVVASVPEGTTEDDVLELVAAFFAGPPASPAAGATPVETSLAEEDFQEFFFTPPLSSGQANWNALDLDSGTYAIVCYMPDPTGQSHVMLGMIEIIVVE
jgi:hypothetical protein